MMKLVSILLLLTLPFAFASCGGDTHESVAEDILDEMGNAVEILKGVTDKESAEAAKDKMAKISERMKDLAERAKKLGEPDEATEKKMKEKYEGKESPMMGLMTEAMRVGTIPGGQDLLNDFQSAMSAMGDL